MCTSHPTKQISTFDQAETERWPQVAGRYYTCVLHIFLSSGSSNLTAVLIVSVLIGKEVAFSLCKAIHEDYESGTCTSN